ncbi:sterile alpha motif domain-containing protein 9-like [Anabas testudineus]|uniref:Schlafen AlbA-2 domain-containing protein n=1 Tax=Anabas testudineus TaxID=64144 RepID=A0A7N6C2A3_ANATE|nr:sterile alpha motif domain-containing protein 9-like [Anabas testudineus]
MADQGPIKHEEENTLLRMKPWPHEGENVHDNDRDHQMKKDKQTNSDNQPRVCKPYPFEQYHNSYRYIINNILDIPESGPLNLIEPCHEYKAFINTTAETKMDKFTAEVVRFAAACMNSRTNGTIHFGVGDKPNFTHGQVLGVIVEDKEIYGDGLKFAINRSFEHKYKQAAQMCIKPPRFVTVLNNNETSSDKCVIEVDIVPSSTICEENIYHIIEPVKKKTKSSKQFFIRDGSSSRDLLAPNTFTKPMVEYMRFVENMPKQLQLRKQSEEKHLSVIKSSTQGSRLSQMITGRTISLDKSHFEQYVIVTNKSHSSQFESLGFLVELNPTAVLDFDPESAKQGLQRHLDVKSTINAHLPGQYKITEGVEEIANKLKLTRNTSWVFCNGGIENEVPSDIQQWLMEKGASVRDVISFLCRKDVLPNKRFLVIFLLLSTVSDKMDPLVETFSTFWQELRGTDQILCVCDNENAFTSWKDLIEARCGIDISGRCIYELSFAEVNGTILSLFSKNRRASRFLPCGGGSRVLLEKEVERSLNTLDVLCVNQCEGGNEDKIAIEENFYKGGKPSWWNFYFSEEPGSSQLIRRYIIILISNTILDIRFQTRPCVLLNLMHVPGCGGTTLAMHTLWNLRDRFRCAVLKDRNAEFSEVANQVVRLLTYDHEEQLPRVPVLLMIDDFDDMEKVFDLQQVIEKECKTNIKSTQVILLNCMRSESPEQTEITEHAFFLGNDISEKEQIQFENKLVEVEKTSKIAKTFYEFMITKNNLKPEYFQDVVRNTLRSFSINQKQSQLLAILTLLNVYSKDAALPFSLCEKFLSPSPKPICGTDRPEELFGKFSNLICSITVKSDGQYEEVKMIHPNIAKCCLQELRSHKTTEDEIADLLHQIADELYERTENKRKLSQEDHTLKHSVEEGFPLHLFQAFTRLQNLCKVCNNWNETRTRPLR